MQKNDNSASFWFFLAVVGLAGWAVPGAGHWLIRERKRAVIILLVVLGLFVGGLYIGSLGVLETAQSAWYIFVGQILASPLVGALTQWAASRSFDVFGRPQEIGMIYTIVAGLLNLLSISNAVYLAYCGRGQLIGTEENG